jgi:hypothetical protein
LFVLIIVLIRWFGAAIDSVLYQQQIFHNRVGKVGFSLIVGGFAPKDEILRKIRNLYRLGKNHISEDNTIKKRRPAEMDEHS